MIRLENITKIYKKKSFEQIALENVNISFREKEFVSILGPSGCGKSTLLNIIGGLLSFSSGNVFIDGKSMKDFKDKDYDLYRKNKVGFIFQNYNLLFYETVLENVALAGILSGLSKRKSIKESKKILSLLGLSAFLNKKPSTLSGGQMQKVAIARALIKNPEVILLDEPTGALDSTSSENVMNIFKKISENVLVIMVTHNEKLAKKYSTRIINIKDGKIENDSNPYEEKCPMNKPSKKNKRVSFLTFLKLSFKNILTKKSRTFFLSLASSIGIIGLATVIFLAKGANKYILDISLNNAKSYPIEITNKKIDYNLSFSFEEKKCENGFVCYYDDIKGNSLNESFLEDNNLPRLKKYLESNYENINSYANEIRYEYNLNKDILNENNESVVNAFSQITFANIKDNFSLVYGNYPEKESEVVFVVNENNNIPLSIIKILNLNEKESYLSLINYKFNVVLDEGFVPLKVVGIIKPIDSNVESGYIGYTDEFVNNILKVTDSALKNIKIYPKTFSSKEKIENILKKYNDNSTDLDKIVYTDYLMVLIKSISKIINITSIIISFLVGISLIVSFMMIAITTHISTLERTKEIGILRSLGASKKDIIKVFNAETIIIGFISGIFATIISYGIINLVNIIIYKILHIKSFAIFSLENMIILIFVSIFISFISGLIPAKKASKKDVVISLSSN